MGNSASIGPSASGALDSYVAELGDGVVYERSLGYTRLLKSVKARHVNGPLVVKFFIKPDPGLQLRSYNKRLKVEREALLDIPNVHNYQVFAETEKAGYLVRQWIASSLYDRISTRPFMTTIEKKWISYQILQALRDARNRGVSHGDIKSSNVLVTSWNWVYITDFATSYKPTYLPLNDPADFAFYFDTAGRRTCYVAPERFYEAGAHPDKSANQILESMDVFSAGCVIAELWLDGEIVFTLSSMFKYRSGESSLDSLLERIQDANVRAMLHQMIALDPHSRPSFDTILQSSRGTLFPESFYSFLHNYIASVNELRTPSPFTQSRSEDATASMMSRNLPSDSDHRLDRIWNEFDSVESYLILLPEEEFPVNASSSTPTEYYKNVISGVPYQDVLPVALHLANRDPQIHGVSPIPASVRHSHSATNDSPALIFLSLVLANLRNASLPSSKLHGMDVLLALSSHLSDEARLDRILPYLVDTLRDDEPLVRLSALRTLAQITCTVTTLTPANATIFPEYILPNTRHLSSDPEDSVRCTFAQLMAPIAETAVRYLETAQALKTHGSISQPDHADSDERGVEGSYDSNMAEIQQAIQEQLGVLLADPHSSVKRAVLHNVSSLCIFLGRQKTNDLLLSHMITYLNQRDWMLRLAFFESVVDVAACIGGKSLEHYILPLMIQSVADSEEGVVAKVLGSFTTLAELGLFSRMRVWELMSATLAFLYHPNIWIRQGSATFIASAIKHLPATDIWAILYPSLRHYLRSDIGSITESELLTSLKPPLSRQVFEAALTWAIKGGNSQFWKPGEGKNRSSETPKEILAASRKANAIAGKALSPKTEEEDQHIHRLRQLGMAPEDEGKLLSLRDYIAKHANAIASAASRGKSDSQNANLTSTSTIELQKLGVVPRTVFLAGKSPEPLNRPFALNDIRSGQLPSSRRTSLSSQTPRAIIPERGGLHVVDDLRRQLAVMNSSNTSISRDRRESVASNSPSVTPPVPYPASFDDAPDKDAVLRPLSPTESMQSVNLPFPPVGRQKGRAPIGLTDSHKAAPAIASTKTNAVGLLEQSVDLRSNLSAVGLSSGRTSPVSNVGTVRAEQGMVREFSQVPTNGQGLLEKLFQEHDTSRDASQDFGPRVREVPLRRRTNIRQTFSHRHRTESKDGSDLIATLAPHGGAINGVAVAPDHAFFVSCSDDKTVKIWDTARLERNVTSKPRHVYTQHQARVTSVCILEKLYCFASAAEDGSIHIVRVQLTHGNSTPKYGKLKVVREHQLTRPGEYATCLLHFFADNHSKLVFATSQGTVSILELTSNVMQVSMTQPRHYGPISCLCLDRKRSWLVTGTLTGTLTLWDIRFGILLKTWTISHLEGRITQCCVHPNNGRGKWIMVMVQHPAVESAHKSDSSIEVWDIEETRLIEVFTSEHRREDKEAPRWTPAPPLVSKSTGANNSAAKAIEDLLNSRRKNDLVTEDTQSAILQSPFLLPESDLPPAQYAISCFTTGSDILGLGTGANGEPADMRLESIGDDYAMPPSKESGFMLTGSQDCRVRFWDLEHLERSQIVCGADIEDEKPVFAKSETLSKITLNSEIWSSRRRSKRTPPRNTLLAGHQQELVKAHQDTITALGCLQYPFRGGVITGDRSGVLKVWRLEVF